MDSEYQHHIRHAHVDLETQSWCGQKLSKNDWVFQNVDHALYSIQQGRLQQPCPDCVAAIKSLLDLAE